MVDSLLIMNAQSTATVISERHTGHETIDLVNDQTTSKLNHSDRTAEVVVDGQRPVNHDGILGRNTNTRVALVESLFAVNAQSTIKVS